MHLAADDCCAGSQWPPARISPSGQLSEHWASSGLLSKDNRGFQNPAALSLDSPTWASSPVAGSRVDIHSRREPHPGFPSRILFPSGRSAPNLPPAGQASRGAIRSTPAFTTTQSMSHSRGSLNASLNAFEATLHRHQSMFQHQAMRLWACMRLQRGLQKASQRGAFHTLLPRPRHT
jgi:hypothetical protein